MSPNHLPKGRKAIPYLPLLKLAGLVRLLQGPLACVPVLLTIDGQVDVGTGGGVGHVPGDHLDCIGVGWRQRKTQC